MGYIKTEKELKHIPINNPIIKQFLDNRGLSSQDIDYLINPNPTHQHSPFLLSGMEHWVDKLHEVKGKRICIFPDYDADGVLSGTCGRVGLWLLGFGDAAVYPPCMTDGYGLSKKHIDKLLAMFPDTEVIITTDNGSNAHEGVAYAKSLGLQVLVTDHHLAEGDPQGADAVVNPNRKQDDSYPFKGISGTTVIYKALMAYAMKYQPDALNDDFFSLVLLVGMSTISDVMPLLNENRFYVTQAVEMLSHFASGHTLERVVNHSDTPLGQYYRGIDLLLYTLNKHEKLKYGINADTFGYLIGPMLNSPRRMIGTSSQAFDLFRIHRMDLFDYGKPIPSEVLFQLNERRKETVRELFQGLLDYVALHKEQGLFQSMEQYMVFTAATGEGIAGLLASEFVKRFRLPSIVFAVNDAAVIPEPKDRINRDYRWSRHAFFTGSGRAPEGFPLHKIVQEIEQEHPEFFVKWGGHASAIGITIWSQHLPAFQSIFVTKVHALLEQLLAELEQKPAVLPIRGEYVFETEEYMSLKAIYGRPDGIYEIPIEKYLPILQNGNLNDSVRFFEQLEPFGYGFPQPTFSLIFAVRDCMMSKMGKDKRHVKLILPNGLTVIHWDGAKHFGDTTEGDNRVLCVTGTLNINEFGGRETLQLIADELSQVGTVL